MLNNLATTHSKIKISLIRTLALCLLLCGTVITGQQERAQKATDGPISVKLGDVIEKGKIKIEEADLTTLPALPRGYSAIPNMAYRITIDAINVGPYTVVFSVASVTDKETFNNLRVLHAEADEFDPDSPVWVDRTATGGEASAPNFADRTITAASDELGFGVYVIAKLTEKLSQNTTISDLEVVAPPAPKIVQMPAHITTSVIVKNNGPETATDVGFKQQISRGRVVSMKPSQGTCKWKQNPGWVYCKLGQLPADGSATILVEIDPFDDFAGQYRSSVEVAGKEIDRNTENNWAVAIANAVGDPNLPPEVKLESPETDQLFEQGATVILKATATDSDGSIMKVEFLDNGQSLGIATTTDAHQFSLSISELANGRHILSAIATDNGNRRKGSNTSYIFINGQIKIRILTQEDHSELTAGSDLTLRAMATNPIGSIKKVEFFNHGFLLGEGVAAGDNHYMFELRGLEKTDYAIEAVATDYAGRMSKSAMLRFNVMK